MKPALYFTILLFAALSTQTVAQDASIFPKGEKAANVHHTGNVWLNELVKADNVLDCHVSVATFDADARLDWHTHPGGQILLITQGTGYYQEKGKSKQIASKGSVIKCLPGVEHWHGASPQNGFTYIAVNTNNEKGKTIWGQKVTDEQYYGVNSPAMGSTNTEQEIINLSKEKWRWMSERKVDTLAALFHEKAVFVHMGGTMTKDQELNVIKSGGIHYKQAEIQETSVQFIGNTALLLNKIRLVAVVGGNEVINPFVVTEVYVQESGKWTLGSMSFTRLLGQ
jgi:quercetin dioxygenase-like cupin family protein